MRAMNGTSPPPILQILLGAACTVIIMAGIRAASSILGPLLLGLLISYAVVPLPKWIMRRFQLSKNKAIVLTAVAAFAFGLFLLFALDAATLRIAQKLPGYEQRLAELYGQATVAMSADGIVAPILSIKNVFTPERINEITRIVLPEAGDLLSRGLMVFLLAFLFVVTMVEDTGVTQGPLAEKLASMPPTRRGMWRSRRRPQASIPCSIWRFCSRWAWTPRWFGAFSTSSSTSFPLSAS